MVTIEEPLSAEDRNALARSAEDMRRGRYATEEQMKAVLAFSGVYDVPSPQRHWLSRRVEYVNHHSSADMTKEQIQAVLESVRFWPQEDQEELAELAREIEARRKGVYVMDDEERAAVEEGLEQARRGEFVSDEEMDAFWKKIGVL